jgi:hypothetical protein
MGRTTAWDSSDARCIDYEDLPIDLTPGGVAGRPLCWRASGVAGASRNGWMCTRPVGHTGRHAAGDGRRVRAVWP